MYEQIAWSLGVVHKKGHLFQDGTLGTCFPLLSANHFVTAAHCVESLTPEEIDVQTIGAGSVCAPVLKISRHSHADLAVLKVELPHDHYVKALSLGVRTNSWGAHVVAFGFPMDTTHFGSIKEQLVWTGPTLRFFRGNTQRWSVFVSNRGYKYYAHELSFASPAGLSGGPVFLAETLEPIGLVTENFESTTYLRTVSEVIDSGHEFRETIHSVVNYAVCLSFAEIDEWLRDTAADA
jgi:hypothetical protein